MIVEFFCNIIVALLTGAINGLSVVTLPVDLVGALSAFIGYGNAIVGVDLLLIFAASVSLWMTAKLSVGVLLFVWRLLPFT